MQEKKVWKSAVVKFFFWKIRAYLYIHLCKKNTTNCQSLCRPLPPLSAPTVALTSHDHVLIFISFFKLSFPFMVSVFRLLQIPVCVHTSLP